ncbi:MAG: diguanylate cyclase domain-containing protein [Mycobacterium sp.]
MTPSDPVEQRYRLLLEHSPYPMCVHADGRVVYVNPAGVRDIGAKRPEELVGRWIADFVHPGSVGPMLARIAALRRDGDSSEPSEAVMLRIDGRPIDAEAVSVLTSWNGKPAYQVIFRDLTAQKAADAAVRYQAALVEHVSDAIVATTLSGVVTSWNPAAEAIYRRPAARALGLPVGEVVGAPTDPAAIVAAGGIAHMSHCDADGLLLEVRVAVSLMANGYVLLCSDQTALRRAEKRFQTVVDTLEDGIVVLDPRGRPTTINPAGLRILGLPPAADLIDHLEQMMRFRICDTDGNLISPDQRPDIVARTTRTSMRNKILGLDLADGKRIWLSCSCRLLDPTDANRSDLLLSFTDVTDQHNEYVLLNHRAHHDALTGLPNRVQVEARVSEALGTGDRALSAVMFIDLDNMKAINDERGHGAGDAVIKAVAQRLRNALRSADFVARLGGDEFVALLFGRTDRAALEQLAARLHSDLAAPLLVADTDHVVMVSASIGVASVAADDPRDAADVLADADAAMYVAKVMRIGTHYT